LFFALVAVGLPFAVTVGWALGEANLIKPPAAATPDGFGGIGTAPKPDKPVKRVGYPERTAGPRPASTTTPVTVRPWTAETSDPPSSAAPVEPPPTPSTAPSEPASSPSASAHPSPEPSDPDAHGVPHHP
jgi:hypothetical protein